MDAQIREIKKYVTWAGGSKLASQRLGCTEGAIRHYLKGRRQIPADVALRIEKDSRGLFRKERLIWGDAA